jgi:hypothetical protein
MSSQWWNVIAAISHMRIHGRQAEVGMIKDVEEFGAKLELSRFVNCETLLERNVEVHEMRSAQIRPDPVRHDTPWIRKKQC